MIRSVIAAWDRFWFAPQPAGDLAVCRILFYGGIFCWRMTMDSGRWGELGQAFWFPIRLFRDLGLPLLDPSTLRALDFVWLVAVALACIGWMTRASTFVALVVGVYLIGLPHNFGKIHHSDAVVVFVLAALALSHCGDAYSVDAVLRRRRGEPAPPASGEYRWPIRVAWLGWVLLYSAAGIAKIRNGGVAWVFSDSFRNILLEHHYTHHPLVSWGLAIAEHPLVCRVLAAGTILVEVLSPLALFGPRLRAVLIPGLAAMQIGIWFVLGVRFDWYLLVLVFWVPWHELAASARPTRPAERGPRAMLRPPA
jgi:hypothetical protein